MEVKAKAKYIHMAPRKVRFVVNLIRGLDTEKAYEQLQYINKAACRPVRKLIDSAVANAKHNFEIEQDNLFIKEIRVDEGPTLQRWQPRAFGRAAPIRKRTSHISLILEEKVPSAKKPSKKKKKEEKLSEATEVKKDIPAKEVKQEVKEPVSSTEPKEIFDARRKGRHRDTQHFDKKDMKQKGFLKKIFKRKSST